MLAEAKPAGLTTAVTLAETCLRQAEEANNTRQVIQITLLQALIYRALGRTVAAFDAFDRALTLAEPNNLTRTFLDLGAPMAEFLQQLEPRVVSSTYVKRLLAAFVHKPLLPGRSDQTAHYVQRYGITPLTPRELELLALVAQRWTMKEMAEHLVISSNTVKRHLSNLYTKLGVHNRRQAVTRAREVGLLPTK
jgi:LuxR family maltose regulon positive regulatory protein